ncbi:MAG: hypothetical protein ACE5HT_11225 [Gemmatimonadales bacterium]
MNGQTIDLKEILQETVSGGYGDLVTRHTGRAVRDGIETALAATGDSRVAVIEFSDVGCLDISCADEIVGKLLLTHGGARYFLLRGVTEAHCEAISLVLERHGLAAVAQHRDGQIQLLGPIEETVSKAFRTVSEQGRVAAAEVADQLKVSAEAARGALDRLLALRLVQSDADCYRALTA